MYISSFLLIATISTPTSSVVGYVAAVFYNGFCAGALLNYSLSHVLHLTLPQTHFIVTSLVAMCRSFASSFGSAVGGGVFSRVLKQHLETRFAGHRTPDGGEPIESLIRRLLGSPALVSQLHGFEKEVAMEAYQRALQTLFFAGFLLAVIMAFFQAGTGWTAPAPSSSSAPKDVDPIRGDAENGNGHGHDSIEGDEERV
jgi:hypothetical protein